MRLLGPNSLDQIRFDFFRDQQQRRFTVPGQARFDQFASVFDAQLEAEVVPPNRCGAIRLDVAECPHVAEVLEQRFALSVVREAARCPIRARS